MNFGIHGSPGPNPTPAEDTMRQLYFILFSCVFQLCPIQVSEVPDKERAKGGSAMIFSQISPQPNPNQ